MKTGIIGAGIAGLAAAVRMAVKGQEVQVFEANAYPGGKLSAFELGDYRFDAGPSLFTMPQYVDELFQLAGKDPSDYFNYERLPVVCNYFWEDGTRLSAYADTADFAREAADKLGVSIQSVQNQLKDSARKYEVTGKIFLEKSLHKISTWTNWKVVKAMLQIPTLDLFTSMNKVHERHAKHPKLVQLFNRFATYNGSNPYKAPGLLSIIPHFEHQLGAFYPRGGMEAISRSIYQLAKDLGVQFHFDSPVERILVENGRAKGLLVHGEELDFDQVISNMDIFFTYRKLLPQQKHPERILRQEKSTSAIIFYWGIQRHFPELDLHNIFFSQDYKKEFAALETGQLDNDPTIYVNISSKYSPEDAPAGHENWFTMINAPYNTGQDWDALIDQARRAAIDKVSRILGQDIQSLITCEEILDPRSIESRTGSHLGSLYGTSSNNKMAAFLRHPNFSHRIKNLYFCGGSSHPGGGIPLCLLSAKIIDELVPDCGKASPR